VNDAPAGRIFLSYRHKDTRHVAGRLYAPLELHFGAGNVFMDVDSIPPGLDFIEAIKKAVGACNIVLALIGPAWLTVTDERGRRRIEPPRGSWRPFVLERPTAWQRRRSTLWRSRSEPQRWFGELGAGVQR
jgi:hypothetical protein